jgi:short-subunit dehydrogenase
LDFWQGKVVLVTGASRGIGLALVRQLTKFKAKLVLVARSEARLKEVADELSQVGGDCVFMAVDVRDKLAADQVVRRAIDKWGRLDIVINNAGVGLHGPVETLDGTLLQEATAINVIGPLNFMQAALPFFKQQQAGLIINIASLGAIQVAPNIGGYAATKAALAKLGEALRMELKANGIHVCTVYPGSARTEFRDHVFGQAYDKAEPRLSRVAPELVAQQILRQAPQGKRDIFITLQDRVFAYLTRVVPAGVEYIVQRVFDRKKRI